VPEVRLVGAAGEQIGIVGIEDALRLAIEADLDLVEVAPEAKPPVCKIMDYGKFKYEAAVKAREARKNQVNTVIKEMKLRPKIDQHDYETKKGHIERFLSQGDKVKITIMFRGREQSRPELGYKLLQKLATAIIESSPLQDGRNMTMVLAPARKTSGGKAAKPAPAKTEYQAPVAAAAPAVTTPVVEAPVVEAPVVEVAPVVEAPAAVVETPVVEAKPAAKKAVAKKTAEAKPAAKKAAAKTAEAKPAAKKVAAKKEPAAKKVAAKKTSKDTTK
jgi:translation initiation factor IF-3